MHSCKLAVLSFLAGVLPFSHAFANSEPEQEVLEAFDSWSGYLHQVTTSNSSVLSEYIALTNSSTLEGAKLVVSFMPRFSCKPIISMLLPDEAAQEINEDTRFVMSYENQEMPFPLLLDREEGQLRITLNTDADTQQQHRRIMDFASWVNLEFETDVPELSSVTKQSAQPDQDSLANFSLMGSRKTVQGMQALCNAHAPIPYNN